MVFRYHASRDFRKNARRRSGKQDSSKSHNLLCYNRRCGVEQLEERKLLSGSPQFPAGFQPEFQHVIYDVAKGVPVISGSGAASAPLGWTIPPSSAFTPQQIQTAYGINQVTDGGVTQIGTGETIAIIDFYDNPKFVSRSSSADVNQDTNFLASDLHQFDLQFGLPEPANFFTKVDQSGGTNYPVSDTGWGTEIALDVEWVHATAPGAKIILVEADPYSDVYSNAISWTRDHSGAVAVSMSWGDTPEPSIETTWDSYFHSPADHGITWLASTGDWTASETAYPAFSPNVVAVGGTSLYTSDTAGHYNSEVGWSDGGGAVSVYESQPSYQQGLVIHSGSTTVNQNGMRAVPDVSLVADPSTGVAVYDSFSQGSSAPWLQVGGTSVSSPICAGLVGIADQIRSNHGLTSLDGLNGTLPTLYGIYNSAQYASDFHDVTTGSNGFSASAGYDLVTGIGTAKANALLPDLAGVTLRATSSTPAARAVVSTPPSSYTVTFSYAIDPASLQASDLTVNSIAANNVSLSADDKTATFTYNTSPVTAQGLQTMAIAAGALTKLGDSSTSLEAFNTTFRYDVVLLQVASTNPAPNGVFTMSGPLTYDVTFNEPISPASVTTSSLVLSGIAGATVTGATVLSGNTTARFTIGGLTMEGTLVATIAAGAVTDQYGNPGTPFSASYSVDIGTMPFPIALAPVAPLGSLIYDAATSDSISPAGDTDTFTLALDPGQTISLLVTPTSSGLQPSVQLLDPTATVIGTATAAAAGQNALIQATSTTGTSSGTYTFVISGASGTLGKYTVQVTLNAAQELKGTIAGATNNTIATAQDINGSFISLTNPASSAQRGAVLGQTPDVTGGYTVTSVPYAFENISTSGTAISFHSPDDDATLIPVGFAFPFYGTNYTNLYVSTNGLITFGSANPAFGNADLTTSPLEAAISPFWDDLNVSGAADSKVIYQVLGSGSSTHLVIQWNDASFYNDYSRLGGLTFEAILGSDGSIRFNYQNLATGRNSGSSDLGANATAGIKDAGIQGSNRVLLMYNNGPTPLVNSGTSVVFAPAGEPFDYYSFTVGAGETDTLAVTNLSTGNVNVDLFDGSGTLIASGISGSANLSKVISNFNLANTTAGTYYARISGDSNTSYSLVMTRNAAFDTEPQGTPQSLDGTQGVLGRVSTGDPTVTLSAVNAGWWDSTGYHIAANTNYVTGLSGGTEYRDYFVFDLSSVTQPFTSAQLNVINPAGGYVSSDPTETYSLFDVSTPIAALEAGGTGQTAIFNDLGSGTTLAAQPVSAANNDQGIPVALDSTAVSSLNASRGSQVALGGAITTLSGTSDQVLFAYSGSNTPQLVLTSPEDDDWYSVTVTGTGTQLNLATSTPGGGSGEFSNNLAPKIELYNAAWTLVATGTVGADGRNETIQYVAPTPGVYRVHVLATNGSQGEYFLSVSKTPSPTVKGVFVSGTSWTSSFLNTVDPGRGLGYAIPVGSGSQLVTLPAANINQIKVVFSENVVVDQSDLLLSGVNTTAYNVSGGTFSYDPTTFTATWTLPQAIGPDKLLLQLNADGSDPIEDSAGNRLDGEWTNPTSTTQASSSTYPSGNGMAGGNFDFRLNVLPGDATQDGSVTGADLIKLLASYNQSGMTWLQGDFTGDGMVTGADLIKLLANYNQTLPSAEPTAESFPASISLAAAVVPSAVSSASAISFSIASVTTVDSSATHVGSRVLGRAVADHRELAAPIVITAALPIKAMPVSSDVPGVSALSATAVTDRIAQNGPPRSPANRAKTHDAMPEWARLAPSQDELSSLSDVTSARGSPRPANGVRSLTNAVDHVLAAFGKEPSDD